MWRGARSQGRRSVQTDTQMGPLTMARQLERVQGYIAKGRAEGARLVLRRRTPAHLEARLLCRADGVRRCASRMTIAQEEIFGPVVSSSATTTIDDAVAKANNTIYGLHGAVYTADAERGYEIARRMRSGSVTVNGMIVDIKMPFGGFKQSGIGREGGIEGLDPYFEIKTIYFA